MQGFRRSTPQAQNEREQKILGALRESKELKRCFLEMIDISYFPLGKLDKGDKAEEAVAHVIQKTGKLLLEEWPQKKSDRAAEESQNQARHHLYRKKVQWHNSLGTIGV